MVYCLGGFNNFVWIYDNTLDTYKLVQRNSLAGFSVPVGYGGCNINKLVMMLRCGSFKHCACLCLAYTNFIEINIYIVYAKNISECDVFSGIQQSWGIQSDYFCFVDVESTNGCVNRFKALAFSTFGRVDNPVYDMKGAILVPPVAVPYLVDLRSSGNINLLLEALCGLSYWNCGLKDFSYSNLCWSLD